SENEMYDLTNEESQEDTDISLDNEMKNDFYSDNLNVRRHSFECSQSRTHKAKKVIDITKQRKCNSAAINCQWHVNFNKRKNATKIEMLEDIEFYTRSTEGLGAKIQYSLLSAKYPNKYIDKKDLYNTIQWFRIPSCDKLKTDAAEALQQLIALKAEDSEWVVVPNIGDGNRLMALFWMSPLQVSL
ncbi:25355_t:CDS:2, partial [Dentiscutata erythropus]